MTVRAAPSVVAMRLLPLAAGVTFVLFATLPGSITQYLAPTLASIAVFGVFSLVLRSQVGDNIFGELGFLYLGFTLAYTLLPAAAFVVATGLAEGSPLALLLPDPAKLTAHLWRQVLFEAGVACGYLVLRGRRITEAKAVGDGEELDDRTIVFVAAVTLMCLSTISLMSAPVTNYLEHYARFDHLPWLVRKFVSLGLRLSLGLYCVLLVFLFRNYKKYRLAIPFVVAAICVYEIVYSYGARIQAMIVLLQAVCLYHYTVKKISLKRGLIACLSLGVLFSAVEVVRQVGGDLDVARSVVSEEGFQPAGEFLSVFYPGFQLYEERAQGTLPPKEWPMLFNDFIALGTFGDFTRWNPMSWYARNYYPEVEIAPFTLGPIADSAIWGGEVDLLIRSVINGLFFAFIMRWFVRRRHQWWALTVYVYCYATCILTLKYSVFLDLSLIAKNLVLTLLLVHAVRSWKSVRPRAPVAVEA